MTAPDAAYPAETRAVAEKLRCHVEQATEVYRSWTIVDNADLLVLLDGLMSDGFDEPHVYDPEGCGCEGCGCEKCDALGIDGQGATDG